MGVLISQHPFIMQKVAYTLNEKVEETYFVIAELSTYFRLHLKMYTKVIYSTFSYSINHLVFSIHFSFSLIFDWLFYLHPVEKASPLKPMPPRKNKLKTRPLLSPDERAKILQKQKDILSPTVLSIVPSTTSLSPSGRGYNELEQVSHGELNQGNNSGLTSNDPLSPLHSTDSHSPLAP